MSRINETLKQKIDEIDLDRRFNDFAEQAEKVLHRAMETVSDFTDGHRDDVERALDKLSASIDERTEGKYADTVVKVRGQIELGIDKLADRRTDDS